MGLPGIFLLGLLIHLYTPDLAVTLPLIGCFHLKLTEVLGEWRGMVVQIITLTPSQSTVTPRCPHY